MKGLIGVLTSTELSSVREATELRFRDPTDFTTPEALVVYEQRMLDEENLLRICCDEYAIALETPMPQYIPKELVNVYEIYPCVPIRFDSRTDSMYVGVLPEHASHIPDIGAMSTVSVPVPIYYYVQLYTRHFGVPRFLHELPPADKLNLIIEEAIRNGAADITITNVAEGAMAYFNVRKKKVHSKRVIGREDVQKFAELLGVRAGQPLTHLNNIPKYLSVQLDMHHRGRVVLNRTYYGYAITIRILSDYVLEESLSDLNVSESTQRFIQTVMLGSEKGLRLFIGETMSGKNTTILAALREAVASDALKIVSIENPVEMLVEGVEQINTESPEEYAANVASLLRQNPDLVYITEITEYTAKETIQASLTGKVVFSSIHATSISDVLSRLSDITGMGIDRLLMSLHSCCYQQLLRDEQEDKLYPINRCLYFSDTLKERLYGKSLGQCKTLLREEEAAWV